MSSPLVTITIPTYNSARTLAACLESIAQQDYPDIETVIVDSNSTDGTLDIAERWGARAITVGTWLLGARIAGIRAAAGEYVLLLDSDHVLTPTMVSRAVEAMQRVDALFLEERAVKTDTFIERLFDADRQLVHALYNVHQHHMKGVLLRRFFRNDFLLEAVANIPEVVAQNAVTFDHEILNYEYSRLSDSVEVLPDAVKHHETGKLFPLWRKNFRYGRTAREMSRLGFYQELRRNKARPRLGALTPQYIKWGLQSTLLLILKSPAILSGYLFGKPIAGTVMPSERHSLTPEDIRRTKEQMLRAALLIPSVLICTLSLFAQRFYISQQVKTLFAVDTTWTGKYYANPDLSGCPVQVLDDTVITFEWGQESPLPGELNEDGFSVEWTRSELFEGREYIFALRSDDGARMYLDGKLIIDMWGEGPHGWVEHRQMMSAGRHRLKVEYFDNIGEAYVQAGYYPPEQ